MKYKCDSDVISIPLLSQALSSSDGGGAHHLHFALFSFSNSMEHPPYSKNKLLAGIHHHHAMKGHTLDFNHRWKRVPGGGSIFLMVNKSYSAASNPNLLAEE